MKVTSEIVDFSSVTKEDDMEGIRYACRTCKEPHSLRTCSLCDSFILSMQCLKNVSINDTLCRNGTKCRMEEILLKEFRNGFIVPKYKEKLAFLTSYHDPHKCSKCWKVSIKCVLHVVQQDIVQSNARFGIGKENTK